MRGQGLFDAQPHPKIASELIRGDLRPDQVEFNRQLLGAGYKDWAERQQWLRSLEDRGDLSDRLYLTVDQLSREQAGREHTRPGLSATARLEGWTLKLMANDTDIILVATRDLDQDGSGEAFCRLDWDPDSERFEVPQWPGQREESEQHLEEVVQLAERAKWIDELVPGEREDLSALFNETEQISHSDTGGRDLTDAEVAHNQRAAELRRERFEKKQARILGEMRERRNPDDRLYLVYQELRDLVRDADGYGGPVAHTAEVDGWELRITNSSFGELFASACCGEGEEREYYGWEWGVYYKWHPITIQARSAGDFSEYFAGLFERAQWHDELERSR